MRAWGMLVAVMLSGCGSDCPPGAPVAAPAAVRDAAPPGNAVQAEMRLLHAAMQAALSGVAYGDVRAVPEALEAVDRAKAATEAALESGQYTLARGGDRLARFRELDESFHGQLEALVTAARQNDVAATATALGVAMQACQACHAEFRK
ncbi:MAG: cytochrome c [Deltaproteobacteria bacterium]|nr:cytochrome c [Deltaproteobacteria bacterium]